MCLSSSRLSVQSFFQLFPFIRAKIRSLIGSATKQLSSPYAFTSESHTIVRATQLDISGTDCAEMSNVFSVMYIYNSICFINPYLGIMILSACFCDILQYEVSLKIDLFNHFFTIYNIYTFCGFCLVNSSACDVVHHVGIFIDFWRCNTIVVCLCE